MKLALAHKDPISLASLYAKTNPSPGQTRFMEAICSTAPEHRQIVVKTCRKGGKTISVAVAFASLFLTEPTIRIFHLSGSYLQASRLYDYFKPIVVNEELFPDALESEPTRYFTRFKKGGCLEVATASAKSIRGGDYDILSIDEAVLVPPPLIDAAWALPRASKRPKRIITSTASPEVNLEWFLRLWQQAQQLGFEPFEWQPEECTWLNTDDNALARKILDSVTYAIEYEGKIGERKGLVWSGNLVNEKGEAKSLIDSAIVDPRRAEQYPIPLAPPATEWSCGLDWGFTHPTVLTVWEKQGETVYARDCRIWSETRFTEIMQEIKEDYGNITVNADSSSPGEIAELKSLGVTVVPVIFSKEKSELISHIRWRLENRFLKIPDPEVDSRFFTLVQQMKAYHYDASGKPAKVNDDAVDSMICGMKFFLHPPVMPFEAKIF